MAITEGRVAIDNQRANPGQTVGDGQIVVLDGRVIVPPAKTTTVLLNKPPGYVCSRIGQGSKTIYELLPPELHDLKSIGRLDKDSSGLLLLTNDGALAQNLTHPRHQKLKIYEIILDKPLAPLHRQMIQDFGIQLEDGPSTFSIERISERDDLHWRVSMREGRNRQIRRTFKSIGYTVTGLHRIQFGPYTLGQVAEGAYDKLPGRL